MQVTAYMLMVTSILKQTIIHTCVFVNTPIAIVRYQQLDGIKKHLEII